MKKSQFFSIYVLIHGLVLALVIGMGAAAFSMSLEGLLILEAPTTATTSANTRGAMVSKIEAEKDKIKRAIKPVVGGCEIWDTFDRGVAAGYYRAKRWGAATASSSNVSDLTSCACPAGTTKILLSHDSQPLTNISLAQDEWRFKYNIRLAMTYPDSLAGSYDQFALSPVCASSSAANSKRFLNRAGSLVSTSTLTINNIDFSHQWNDESEIPANYVQQIGYCYVHHGIDTWDGNCCCETGCSLYPSGNETLVEDPAACSRAQNSANYYGILRDHRQWWLRANQMNGWPAFNAPSGCGLSVYNHTTTSTLPSGATTSVDKWICVANSNYGWDNNWGLP